MHANTKMQPVLWSNVMHIRLLFDYALSDVLRLPPA
jgi:hypothetical protein